MVGVYASLGDEDEEDWRKSSWAGKVKLDLSVERVERMDEMAMCEEVVSTSAGVWVASTSVPVDVSVVSTEGSKDGVEIVDAGIGDRTEGGV